MTLEIGTNLQQAMPWVCLMAGIATTGAVVLTACILGNVHRIADALAMLLDAWRDR